MTATEPFDQYVAIDWSGGTGRSHKGIAVAVCGTGAAPPAIVTPPDGRAWARMQVLEWLTAQMADRRVLVGFDFSFSAPYIDLGCYFPGLDAQPDTVRDYWAMVETACADDADLGARGFVQHPDYGRYFLIVKPAGERFARRYRLTEHVCREGGLGRAQSLFHLIGPNQVGLASLSGMRLLRRLDALAAVDIWPLAEPRAGRSAVVEMYTATFIRLAGRPQLKLRTVADLNGALAAFDSAPVADDRPAALSDHDTDALLAAAGLRALSAEPRYWRPPLLSDKVRRTEGWVFGVT